MKKVVMIMFVLFVCAGTTLCAASGDLTVSGKLGVGTSTPAISAALDVASTGKGFLPPRMTTAQRDAIATPAAGLLVYNTDNNAYNYYTGTSWTVLPVKTQQLTDNPLAALLYRGYSDYSVTSTHSNTDYYYYLSAGTVTIDTSPAEYLLSVVHVFGKGTSYYSRVSRALIHISIGRLGNGNLAFYTEPLLSWGQQYAAVGVGAGAYSSIFTHNLDPDTIGWVQLRIRNASSTTGELQIKVREYTADGNTATSYIALHRLDFGNLSEKAMPLTAMSAW